MAITKGIEDYLEAIIILEKRGEKIKSVRVAELLGVSKPAVNQATKELIMLGYITKENYGEIILTDSGRTIAIKTHDKHAFLKKFLIAVGVSEQTADTDACKIEHIISQETLDKLKEHIKLIMPQD